MTHPLYKLGKKTARIDTRTIPLRALMAAPVKVPPEYSYDVAHPGVPMPMFLNNELGDCVMAARAHQTLRFEFSEQGKLLVIKDSEVSKEYFKETGGGDDGLVMLDSLTAWRKGWRAAGKTYKIKGFASINTRSPSDVQQTVFANIGCQIGVNLPLTAQDEIDAGKPWSQTTGRGSGAGSWGGHCVFVVGYTKVGPVCITWGQKQQMTWAWFYKYCDEAYAVIDAMDSAKVKRLLISEKRVDAMISDIPPAKET